MKRKTDAYTLALDIDYRLANTRNRVTNEREVTEDYDKRHQQRDAASRNVSGGFSGYRLAHARTMALMGAR